MPRRARAEKEPRRGASGRDDGGERGQAPGAGAAAGSSSVVRPYFEALLLLLLGAGFLTLAGTGRLSAPVVLIGVVALLLRFGFLWSGKRPHLSNSFSNIVSVLYLVFYPLDVYFISRGFLAATVHLVLLVAVVKLFSASRPRDFAYLCVLAFLEVLAAATLTVGSGFLAYFALFLVLTIATVVSYEVFRAESAATVRAAAGGSRARARRPRPGRAPARSQSLPRAMFSVSLAAALCVALCGAGLFFVLPRFAFGYWNPNAGARRLSGFSDEVRLGEMGDLQLSDVPVLHIRVLSQWPKGAPGGVQWRLRGRILTEFDGRRWFDPHRALVMPTRYGRLRFEPDSSGWTYPHRFLRYTVALDPVGADVLFVAPRLLDLGIHLPNIGLDATGTLSPIGRGVGGLSYTAFSDLGRPTDAQLRAAGRAYSTGMAAENLRLPPDLDPRVPALARRIVAGRRSALDQMRALADYLRSHYRYTLKQRAGGPHPLADFLFRVRAGDCEYFASALAVMGRSLGIPTRVVNGFAGGQYNPYSGEYVIRGRDAHSWVQAYFPTPRGGGVWVAFDGTAGNPEALPPAWSKAQMYLDAMRSFWREWVIDYDFFHQMQLARGVRAAFATRASAWSRGLQAAAARWLAAARAARPRLESGVLGAGRRARNQLLALLIVLLAIGALLWGGPWRNPILARRNSRAAAAEATVYYRRLRRRLARAGFAAAPELTAEELLARLPEAGGFKAAARRFLRRYQQVRFGADGAALAQLPADLRWVEKHLRALRR